MAEVYVQPFIPSLQAILAKYMPEMLSGTGYPPFMEIGIQFSGIAPNPPQAWVMPLRSTIDDEGNQYDETHLVQVRFAVTASDPDALATAAMAYMVAISQAIDAAQPTDWAGVLPRHVHVYEHDYGPLFVHDGVMMKFPELNVEIQATEI